MVVRTGYSQGVHLLHVLAKLGRVSLAQLGPEVPLHDVEATDDGPKGQEAVGNLVEHRVLCVEVVDLDTRQPLSSQEKPQALKNKP